MPPPDVAVPSGRARLRVLDIILKTNTPLKWAEVKVLVVGNLILQQKRESPECPEAKFPVFRNLPPSQLVLQINYPYFGVSRTINVKGMDLLSSHKRGIGEKRAWQHSFGKLELVIEFECKDGLNGVGQPLNQPSMAANSIATACEAQSTEGAWLPITDHILGNCPQFRILVIGKPGAGISALINEVFGATFMIRSRDHEEPSIDREIQPEGNPYLLFHYAPYIEPDSDDAIQIIQNFIKRRSQLPDVEEKLHAIWVFVEIPITCVPLMDPGLEMLLDRMKKEGFIPNFIVIFTKFDRLVDMERYSLIQAGQAKPTFNVTWGYAKSRFISEYMFPFESRMGKTILYLFVSVYDQYRTTLCELIEMTFKIVEQHIPEAAIVLGISQKISASVKIRICVKLGVENYWRGQETVHNEIVKVWNFDDDQKFLHSPEFKKKLKFFLILEEPNLGHIHVRHMPMLKVSNALSPRKCIEPRQILYALNLVLVLQNLFWIENRLANQPRGGEGKARIIMGPGHHRRDRVRKAVPITRRFIKMALKIHQGADRNHLLTQTDKYTRKWNYFIKGRLDATMKNIILLIASFTKETEIRHHPDFISLYKIHKSLVSIEDEPWISTPAPDSQVSDVRIVNPGPILEVGIRFRILIIGGANAGKTTILKRINDMAGDTIIYNSKGEATNASLEPTQKRGEHDIENDMVFSSGPPFIYHDSCGLEAGSTEEFRKVKDFLTRRAETEELPDRIDVIWYCIAMNNNRPIRHPEKQFFSVLSAGIVPIVVVFTKCEALEIMAIKNLEDAGHTFDEAIEQAPKYIEEHLKNTRKTFETMDYPPQEFVCLRELDRSEGDCQELLECTAKVLGYATLQDLNNEAQKGSLDSALKH